MQKIAILGASGFVGRNLTQHLTEELVVPFDYLKAETALSKNVWRQQKLETFDVIINLSGHNPIIKESEVIRRRLLQVPLEFIQTFSNDSTLVINTSTYVQNMYGKYGSTVNLYGQSKFELSSELTFRAEKNRFRLIDIHLFTLFGIFDRKFRFIPQLFSCILNQRELNATLGEQLIGLTPVEILCKEIREFVVDQKLHQNSLTFSFWPSKFFRLKDIVETFLRENQLSININWGAIPYSGHEMLFEWPALFPHSERIASFDSVQVHLTKLWNKYTRNHSIFI